VNTLARVVVLSVLLVAAPSRCLALISVEQVSVERARELGLEVRSRAAGPDAVRVELEFETRGELKRFAHVDLEIWDGETFVMSATLRESRPSPGRVTVAFSVRRADLDKLTLRVLEGEPLNISGHDLRLRDFVDLEKLR
jgi:hypothetical protein